MNCSPLLLENEPEALATLQDALAFIDAFEAETLAQSGEEATPGESTNRSRRRCVPSSTGARSSQKKRSHTERVKCELERLRKDAEALEATLKRLKLRSSETLAVRWAPSPVGRQSSSLSWPSKGSGPRVATWMEIVMEEYRRRRESEALNRRLRVMLSKQFNMVQASEAALSFRFTDADFDALYGPERRSGEHQGKALTRSLSSRVRQLQLDVDAVLKRTGLTHIDSFFSWSQRKHDELFGVYFESTLCLPVPFGLEQITKAFTNEICKSKRISEMKSLFDSSLCQETKVVYQEQTFDLSIQASLRTLAEEDRVIYMWSAQAWLPSRQWTFLEDSIIVVRRANATSLLQNWHRVWIEDESALSDPLQESILSALSHRGGDHLRAFKSSMEPSC